jgi:hypothetical protein
MLTDHWIIAQLLAQLCAVALLLVAASFSLKALRHWDANKSDERQIALERETYLVASFSKVALLFLGLGLLLFLLTVNLYLPGLVKGAMCATGTLNVNNFGYPALFTKIGGLFLYAIFLSLNHFDHSEPGFPLTPLKFWLIIPAMLVAVADLALSAMYFYQISPDIITTCCSVSFLLTTTKKNTAFFQPGMVSLIVQFFTASFILLAICLALLRKIPFLTLLAGILFVASGVVSLKFFYVKYIYGLPTHLCLFDLFFGQYYYVGYAIFGAHIGLLCVLIFRNLGFYSQKKLLTDHRQALRKADWLAFVLACIAFGLPFAFWLTWSGNL